MNEPARRRRRPSPWVVAIAWLALAVSAVALMPGCRDAGGGAAAVEARAAVAGRRVGSPSPPLR